MKKSRGLLSVILFAMLTASLVFFGTSIGFSQEYTTSGERQWLTGEALDLTIAYYNRQIYHVNSPIVVEFSIANQGFASFLFQDSDNKVFTFDFEVLTRTNREVPHSRAYAVQIQQFEPVHYGEIALKHHEVYGARIDLNEWFDFTGAGEYVIRGVFYPNLKTGSDDDVRMYSDNVLYLDLKPPYTEEIREQEKRERIARLEAEDLAPYEVIELMLESLQEKNFDLFFVYIKFDEFIRQFQNARQLYLQASDAEKPRVIEQFKEYLQGENDLEEIPFSETIPADFTIERTVIDNEAGDAEVIVIETFKYRNLVERKRYKYFLHRYGGKWLLENYTVTNL
jgi:hypothetical protein